MAARLFERYTTEYDGMWDTIDNTYLTQTFTIGNTGNNVSFNITYVKLFLIREEWAGELGLGTIMIRETDGDGKPTGPDLSTGTFDAESINTEVLNWYTISMSYYELQAGKKYALILKVPGSTVTDYLYWVVDSISPTYTGGSYGFSFDLGNSWSLNESCDCLFEVWGIPISKTHQTGAGIQINKTNHVL